ncbi:MATE efflux family protein [Microdochium trichocladiopsis]|uniref:MATE efflux family protein n=1 Tax=Microdochium trichocladiopsis TaxID=1682393 RepID=A0A9P8Y622_9PEZI|nr:MATE efflux family protein [Microdochium trichocladiopsis]KAH7030835.1 MATE efflux family protein [Microdochium trichocladiopsis]
MPPDHRPRAIASKPRRPSHDIASSFAASFRSSFLSTSPLAQEIVARDLAVCSDNDDEGGDDYGDDHSNPGARDPDWADDDDAGPAPVLYTQPIDGVAFGFRRPSIVLDQGTRAGELTAANRAVREQSRRAERSLLRDNHILPPKHDRSGEQGLLNTLYRRMFSTKVPLDAYDDDATENGACPPSRRVSETSPLLSDHAGAAPAPEDIANDPALLNEQWQAAVESGKIKTTWQREAKTIATYSRSLIVTFLLQYSINIASVFAVGRIGIAELGAVTLGSMSANIVCYAPMQGLATSLDTLCAQAYGSGHKHLVGLQLQRMTYFLWVLMLPIAVLFYFGTDVLLRIVPEPESAELAGLYLRVITFGIPGFVAYEGGKRFVQAQGLFVATTYVLLITAPLNILLNWFFVWHLGWGFIGAPIAVALIQTLNPIMLFLYVVFVDGSQCWGGFTKRALNNWGPMVRLALPGMIMVEAEWLAFEILTLATSQFGADYLAAQSILVTLTSATFQIPFPVSIAASTRIANLIGAKLADAAKTSAKVAVVAALAISLLNTILLSTLRNHLPLLFTSDPRVVSLVADLIPLCAAMQVFDGMACMAHGLLRGIGKQGFGGYVNLLTYYVLALPISFATAFGPLGWKLEGLWLGVTIGLAIVAVVEYTYIYKSDWNQSVRDAERRNTAG